MVKTEEQGKVWHVQVVRTDQDDLASIKWTASFSLSHQLQPLSPFRWASLDWCFSFIPMCLLAVPTRPLMALLNGTSPRSEQSSVLLPASSDRALALAFVYDLTDRFQSTPQFLAKHIWINSQWRHSEAVSKCFTKIQIFYICYVCLMHLFWNSIKKAIKFFWQVLVYVNHSVFLTVILSCSEKPKFCSCVLAFI